MDMSCQNHAPCTADLVGHRACLDNVKRTFCLVTPPPPNFLYPSP
jgi:hypothetical protein